MDFCCCCLPGNCTVHQTLSSFINWKRNTILCWWFILLMKGSYTVDFCICDGKATSGVGGTLFTQVMEDSCCLSLKGLSSRHIFQGCILLTATEMFSRSARWIQGSNNRETAAKHLCENKQKWSILWASAKSHLEAQMQTLNLQSMTLLAPKESSTDAGLWRLGKIWPAAG